MTENQIDAITVIPTGEALGAEVRGIDLAKDVSEELIARLKEIWAEHMVLLLRGQFLEKERMAELANMFGGLMVPGSHSFLPEGRPHAGAIPRGSPMCRGSPTFPTWTKKGKPQLKTEGSGSAELLWHSDNSYMETPPMGSLLNRGAGADERRRPYPLLQPVPSPMKRYPMT